MRGRPLSGRPLSGRPLHGWGRGYNFSRGGGAGFDPSALAIINAFTTPPTAQRATLINSTVQRLKSGGGWSLLDVLYMLAAADSQASLINWKNPGTFDGTVVNSPTFAADRGYTGDGATSYVTSSYTPSNGAEAVNLTLTSTSLFAWNRTAGAPAGTEAFVGTTAGGATAVRLGAATVAAQLHSGSTVSISHGGAVTGLLAGNRSGDTRTAYLNGVASTPADQAPTAIATGDISGLRVAATFSAREIAMMGAGGSLTAAQHAALYAAALAYMQGVGAA